MTQRACVGHSLPTWQKVVLIFESLSFRATAEGFDFEIRNTCLLHRDVYNELESNGRYVLQPWAVGD